jgi:hypothetical protein
MCEERLNDELVAIEAALCSLRPAQSGIERDRLMFLAGRASAGRGASFGVRRIIAAFRGSADTVIRQCRTEEKTATSRCTPKLLWPLATAASLFAAATFGILWATGSNRQPVEGTTEVAVVVSPPILDAPADFAPPSPWENRRLCRLVLEKGIDAMPEESRHYGSVAPPVPREETYRTLLRQFLDNPTG